jgi:hypothetical protein
MVTFHPHRVCPLPLPSRPYRRTPDPRWSRRHSRLLAKRSVFRYGIGGTDRDPNSGASNPLIGGHSSSRSSVDDTFQSA